MFLRWLLLLPESQRRRKSPQLALPDKLRAWFLATQGRIRV